MSKLRSALYLMARLLGDISAIKHHRVKQRIARRIVGRITGRIIGSFFR